jgi:glycosyltransferase involved in cell wall biosynthesis
MLAEVLRAASRKLARYANPLARLSWRRAALVLVQNPETRDWLPATARSKVVIFPNAVFEEEVIAARPRGDGPLTALFAGRLVPWKGAALAVRAIALCPGWRLVICGEGPESERLGRLAQQLKIADRVELRGWRPREELLQILREETDVVLFPSLHDEGGWAVAEAVAAGVPVVCLGRGGPPVLGGHPVATTSEKDTVAALAAETMNVRGARPLEVDARDLDSTRKRLVALLQERHLAPPTERNGS